MKQEEVRPNLNFGSWLSALPEWSLESATIGWDEHALVCYDQERIRRIGLMLPLRLWRSPSAPCDSAQRPPAFGIYLLALACWLLALASWLLPFAKAISGQPSGS